MLYEIIIFLNVQGSYISDIDFLFTFNKWLSAKVIFFFLKKF